MQTYESGVGDISWPDDPCWCFDRLMVNVTRCELGKRIYLKIGLPNSAGTGFSTSHPVFEDYRDPIADDFFDYEMGKVSFVISRYLQCLFADSMITDDTITSGWDFRIELTSDVYQEPEVISLKAYWGGFTQFQKSNLSTHRIVRYYTELDHHPQMWFHKGYDVYVSSDHGAYEFFRHNDETIINHLSFGLGAKTYDVVQRKSSNVTSTFDSTFDQTFYNYLTDEKYTTTVIFDDCTSGIFLKWIDPTGLWCGYLFQVGSTTYKTQTIGDDYETFWQGEPNVSLSSVDYGLAPTGYYGALRPQGKTLETTKELCAPGVHKYERAFLKTILSSPMVYMSMDKDRISTRVNAFEYWTPVRISTGSFVDSTDIYDDFIIQMQMPNDMVQTL